MRSLTVTAVAAWIALSTTGNGPAPSRYWTLFLATPVSWKGTLQQYVGRLHRAHHNKREVRAYDYVDAQVPMLARMFKKRLAGYDANGYSLASTAAQSAPPLTSEHTPELPGRPRADCSWSSSRSEVGAVFPRLAPPHLEREPRGAEVRLVSVWCL